MKVASLAVYAHVQAGLDQCTSCHDASALKKSHEGVSPDTSSAAEVSYLKEYCLKCHGTYAGLAKLTEDSSAFQTPDGKNLNPHLPPTARHASAVECRECHRFHTSLDPLDYCFKCHMAGVLECYTCHGKAGG